MIMNRGPSMLGGNMRLRPGLIGISSMMCCSQCCPVRRGLSSGLKLDPWVGHHQAAYARAGVLGQRWFAIESVVARICREAGGRVRTNVTVRDLDVGIDLVGDVRRLEVVVDGLPLFGGRQLAVDATLVGALHADGSVRPSVAARRRKERTYPESVRPGSRTRLVVLAGEIGGRWSAETRAFVSHLAKARFREEIPFMQRRVEQAWRLQWGSMLACASARAVASSPLELRRPRGADGEGPSSREVDAEFRYTGLA